MSNEEKKKLEKELETKSHEELVDVIVGLKDNINMYKSLFDSVNNENESLKKGLKAVKSVMDIINV